MNASLNAPAALVVRRTIAANAEELFDAWLDPEALGIWMQPVGIRHTAARVDARVGGSFEIIMQSDEKPCPHNGVYQVIDRPRQLVFTWASHATQGLATLVTVDFLPLGERTEVVITHEQLPDGSREAHTRGWTSAVEKLASFRAQRDRA